MWPVWLNYYIQKIKVYNFTEINFDVSFCKNILQQVSKYSEL